MSAFFHRFGLGLQSNYEVATREAGADVCVTYANPAKNIFASVHTSEDLSFLCNTIKWCPSPSLVVFTEASMRIPSADNDAENSLTVAGVYSSEHRNFLPPPPLAARPLLLLHPPVLSCGIPL